MTDKSCPNHEMAPHQCADQSQCFEPCGALGHDAAYAKRAPTEVEINEGHYIEVMDRLHIINSMINDFLLDHPLVMQTDALLTMIEKAQDILGAAYQTAGRLAFDMSEDGNHD